MRRFVCFGVVLIVISGLVAGVVSAAGGSGSSAPLRPWGFGVGSAPGVIAVPHIHRARTLRFRAHDFTATVIDNDPAGTSQGDEIAVEGLLTGRDGEAAGRLEAHEVLTGLTPGGGGRLQLQFTVLLANGQISGNAVLGLSQSGASNAKAAVVGGTGRYRNVRGEVLIHPAGQTTQLTFVLIP
jgi:hypothetical protein